MAVTQENVIPLHDRIVVRQDPAESVTQGGILIAPVSKEKSVIGTVLAIGTGKHMDNGQFREIKVAVGDRVLYGKHAGEPIKLHDDEVIIMREDEVLAILRD
jgi:chaperonin GroES